MIVLSNDVKVVFSSMGLFSSKEAWCHPEVAISSYEFIFVTEGIVYIEEDGKEYTLRAGDLFCLRPNVIHRGVRESKNVSFYWLHFYATNYDSVGIYHAHTENPRQCTLFFKELNHLATIAANPTLIECKLLAFLYELREAPQKSNKLFSDACEYIRVHIAAAPSVSDVANFLGYSKDYVSRLFVKFAGMSLKSYLDRERNSFAKSLLLSTAMNIRDIAEAAGFENDKAFLKFFRYHNKTSPTAFRNSCFASHTNIK